MFTRKPPELLSHLYIVSRRTTVSAARTVRGGGVRRIVLSLAPLTYFQRTTESLRGPEVAEMATSGASTRSADWPSPIRTLGPGER